MKLKMRPALTRISLALAIFFGLIGVVAVGFALHVALIYHFISNNSTALLEQFQYQDQFTVLRRGVPQAVAAEASVSILESAPSQGEADAPVTVVEFADFGCPFSRDESLVLRELTANYPDRIRYQYRQFPIDELHPNATHAAIASHCANMQGKFWPMHDKLFINQEAITDADLKRYAKEVGLDTKKFNTCFTGKDAAAKVAADVEEGQRLSVRGTPTFFINGVRIEGAIPKEAWTKIIDLAARIKK